MANKQLKETLKNIEEVNKFVGKKVGVFEKKHGQKATILLIAGIVFLVVMSGVIFRSVINTGVKSAKHNYDKAKEESRDEAKEKASQTAYEYAIKKYQATNEVYISVTEIKETANLQVLSVIERDVAKQTEEEKDKIEYWILYEGIGTYTINLQISEFIVDQERHYVSVRIPRPELTVTYGEGEIKLNTQKGLFDRSSKEGFDIYKKAQARAQSTIREKIENNKEYTRMAEEQAKEQLEKLIRLFNNDVVDLEVDIRFYDE